MNRLVKSGILIMMIVLFSSIVSFADSGSIKIHLDGADIVSDALPLIVNGRTLVPARAVFEAMGGTVKWSEASGEVIVTVNNVNVKLKIGSKKAYINGTEKTLDVPAGIIYNRTMIPVRFVSEAVGCQVSWDDKNRIVSIVSPTREEDDFSMIGNIELSREGDRVIINADREITDFESFKMVEPSRFVLDIQHAKLGENDGMIKTEDNPFFKSIRYSQYTKDSVRIVADLTDLTFGAVSRSNSMRTAYITFEERDPESTGGVEVVEQARQKLVVIDPGHGGSDTGSRGYENGVAVLNEKDVNLDIALRLQKMLEAAGARVYMIRTEDETIPLYDRQDTANDLNASLYVAIHNNSYLNSTPSGTEVHYRGNNDPIKDGISAMALAKNLQTTLAYNLGLPNRGAKISLELAVLRRTIMPAVIIEGAFISNPNDLNYMKTDDFREKYAASTAKCIIEALNESIE